MDVHFREKYRCNVLAINRNGEYIQTDVGTEKLKPGDALLIHGEWKNIERISADLEDVIVIGSASTETETSSNSIFFETESNYCCSNYDFNDYSFIN